MIYKYKYKTPNELSNILMNSDGKYLTGLWFEKSKDTKKHELVNGLIYILVENNLILYPSIK